MPVITWTMEADQKPADAAEWEDIINEIFGPHGGGVTIDLGEKHRWRVSHAQRDPPENVRGLRDAGKPVDT